MYLINGATGNTGSIIAEKLLEAGKKVRIISRSEDKVKALKDKGAEVMIGDLNDSTFVKNAFVGIEAAYILLPPNTFSDDYRAHQYMLTDNFEAAIRANGTKYVVTLSSIGAHLPQNGGVVQGLNYMENKFNAIEGLNVVHLRPGYFYQNLLGQVGAIKHMGIMGSPINGDAKIVMVHTNDIAEVAGKYLLDLNFTGSKVRYLAGTRDLTFNEVTKILGTAIGKPDLQYSQFPPEAFKQAMSQYMSGNVADLMNEFQASVNSGDVMNDFSRSAESTTSTSIEDFAPTFAQVFSIS